MDILTQWVTEIIVFVLLATVIDLLVPATAVKKYINLVIGLILILIFLKPIFFLFDVNIQQAIETSFSQLNQEKSEGDNIENLIEIKKKEIEDSQAAYILEEVAVPLKELARTPLFENYQAEITDIKFHFASEQKKLSYEDLEEVIVYLKQAEVEGDEYIALDVEEIMINTDEPIVNEEVKDTEEIKGLLQDLWEIENKKLTIVWEGGVS